MGNKCKNNQNHSTSPVLLYCRICCTSLGEIISRKQTEPVLNQACRSITGCLKPTNVEDLYLIAGIAPPDIRREVCARVERTKQTKDERHSLFDHTPAPAHLKSRHPFLPYVQPMDFSAKTVRCMNWRARLREKLHIDVGLPTEDLAKGHNSPWLTWRSLNRLRTGYTCSKEQRKK